MKKTTAIFLGLFFVTLVTMGAKITDNELNIGDGNPAVDKQINLSTGQIKWDGSATKLRFSNDGGSSFKDIGSGGGGGAAGINILDVDDNADFEGPSVSPWVASGGTFILESSVQGFGGGSGSWDSSAAAQTLDSALKEIPEGLLNRSCNTTMQLKWVGTPTDLKMQVIDQTSAVIAERDLPVTTDWEKTAIQFTCPGSGSLRVRLLAVGSNPALILFDNVSLGKTDFVDISQALMVAHITYPATASCFPLITSTSFIDYPTDSDCVSPIVVFSTIAVDSADNDLLDLDFDDLPVGTYHIQAKGAISLGAASVLGAMRITDGSTNGSPCGMRSPVGDTDLISELVCDLVVTYTSSGARNFKLQGRSASGNNQLINSTTDQQETTWTIWRVPGSSAEAITLETIGEHWDVSIGGANPSLGTANVSSYTEIIDAGLDLVVNSGSKSAEIPCSTTNPSTGLTCAAGSEGVGVVIDIATAGRYRACFSFAHAGAADGAGALSSVFQVVETPNNSQTISQEGKSKVNSGPDNGPIAQAAILPLYVCGDFIFSSAGQKTLRLMYEQLVGATVSTSILLGDRETNEGQRDIHITVDKLDQQMPTPVFTDLTNSLNAKIESADPDGVPRLYSSLVISIAAGVPSIFGGSDENITSISDDGVGTVGVVFDNDYTSQPSIKCFCIVGSLGSNFGKCNINEPSITTSEYVIETRRGDDGALFDNNNGKIQTFCIGK